MSDIVKARQRLLEIADHVPTLAGDAIRKVVNELMVRQSPARKRAPAQVGGWRV